MPQRIFRKLLKYYVNGYMLTKTYKSNVKINLQTML